ncbi:prolipoprotein diacylglyceryl transferase [Thermoleophilum album]|uniref:Phosphatidylglycerol:prolipoprotein diacylglycerol transferase n=1 Tax=Thermoleophilum album TaxID=29539 RepID=A0A1H6FZN0_THEAL|nr:prolipoprotein diacylglyceryl transferase [Thermoleophilum album]SEH16266.1 phosphatidylglycerol:prolipoprotein diacylglycerol transferase [Thermoleophilum album]
MDIAVITIGIDPTIELGPITLAWHGIGIAAGIAVGAVFARRYASERDLDREALLSAVIVIALAGIVGARLFFLLENDPGALLRPADWFGTNGFAFYGGMIFGTAAAALFLWRTRLGLRYLDAIAAGFPIGMAVGRVGDVINGEHYGPPSDLPWAVRNTHPDADVPSTAMAYHSGGLYEVVLALVMFAVIWPLRHRFQKQLTLLWTVVGAYGLGRFVMFFYRADSEDAALGLNGAQWTSVALVGIAAVGIAWAKLRKRGSSASDRP